MSACNPIRSRCTPPYAHHDTARRFTATGANLSLGLVRWPHDDDPRIDRTLTYRNLGTTARHLSLAAGLRDPARQPAAGQMVRIAPAEIDVPAGGSVDVVVTVDTNGDFADGRYEGAVTATGDDVRIVTPLAVEREVPSHDLTIRVRDLAGNPTFGVVPILDLIARRLDFLGVEGEQTVRLPRSRYSLFAIADVTLAMAYPRLELDHDAVVDFDGRLTQPIALKVVGADPTLLTQEIWYVDVARRFGISFAALDQLFSASFGPESADVQSWAIASNIAPFETDEPDPVYLLAHRERGHLVTGWSEVIEPRQLARVDAHHRGHGVSGWRKWAALVLDDAPQLGTLGGMLGFTDHPTAFARTEYYYAPGFLIAPLVFESDGDSVANGRNVFNQNRAVRYRPGSHTTEIWNRAPFAPAFADRVGNASAQRTGDVLTVTPSMLSDQGTPARFAFSLADHERGALYRDGALILEPPFLNLGQFPSVEVPPGPATYRLERSISRGAASRWSNGEPLFELSTEVSAAWTFRSGHVDGTALLALPTLRFTPELDNDNRTSARLFALPFTIERPPGAPTPAIAEVHLEVSFDDGAHWMAAPVLRLGDHAVALLLHPRTAQFVSLRGAARDVAGNRVEQTIIHAYGLAR